MDQSTIQKFWSRVSVRGPDDCWEWLAGLNRKGYGLFYASRSVGTVRAHRFALAVSAGTPLTSHVVMHTCDNPACCNPAHLKAGTHAENMSDMKRKGRSSRLFGLDNRACKFTAEVVEDARKLHRQGVSQRAIGKMLGISKTYAHELCVGAKRNVAQATRCARRNWPR